MVHFLRWVNNNNNIVYLSVVLSAPALDKGHADGAHLRQLVDRLEPVVHGLGQQRRKLLVQNTVQRWRHFYMSKIKICSHIAKNPIYFGMSHLRY